MKNFIIDFIGGICVFAIPIILAFYYVGFGGAY